MPPKKADKAPIR